MNKKLTLGALAIVLLMSASPVNATYDEDSVSGRVGQAWQSLKDFVVTNLGLDPLLDVDLRGSPRKVERPATTAAMFANAHFEGMRVESVNGISFMSELFPSDNNLENVVSSPQYLALQQLKKLEQAEDLRGLGFYVDIDTKGEEALRVSSIPYYGSTGRVIDMGNRNINPDDSDGMSALLAQASCARTDNPNIKRLGLLVSTGG